MMKKAIAVLLSVLMICGLVPLGMIQGFAAQTEETQTDGDDYPVLELRKEIKLDIDYYGKSVVYKFVPEKDDTYLFTGRFDEYINLELMDSNFEVIAQANDTLAKISENLKAGQTYYLRVETYYSSYGYLYFYADYEAECTGIKVVQLPDDTNYYEGADYDEPKLDGLVVETTWSDGETVTTAYDKESEMSARGQRIRSVFYNESNIVKLYCNEAECSFDISRIANPVESIEVAGGSIEPIQENKNGSWNSIDYDDGEEGSFFEYYYPSLNGLEIKINYTDGTSEITKITDENENFKGYPFKIISSSQYYKPWEPGDDNYITISYLGKTTDVKVRVIEDPFDYIEVIHPTENVLVENIEGYEDTYFNDETGEYEDYFRYYESFLDDIIVRVHYKDGSYKDAKIFDEVDGERIDAYTEQNIKPYKVGSDNKIHIYYKKSSVDTYITVIENPVKSLEVLDGFRLSLIENIDGEMTNCFNPETGDYDKEYFGYYTSGIENARILITYKDGSTKIVHPHDALDYSQDVIVYHNQEENPWEKGKENFLTVSYLGVETQVPVDIIDTPVKSIEVVKYDEIKLIENLDGYWERPWAEYDFEDFFKYYIPDINGVVVKINYNDGTSKTAEVGSYVDGREITWSDNQLEKHFVLGSDNYITIEYAGVTTELPVTVVENPIESITVNSAPTRVYYFGELGFDRPDDINGLNFTLNFKDGTKKTYNYTDADEYNCFDGYEYFIRFADEEKVGLNDVEFKYMGKTAVYQVEVKESPVESIDIVKMPDIPERSYYYPDFTSMQLKFNYKDGTSKLIDLGSVDFHNNLSKNYFGIRFDVDGHEAVIYEGYGPGYTIKYLGTEKEIDGLEQKEDKYVVSVASENYSAVNPQGTVLKVTYNDDTKEEIKLNKILFMEKEHEDDSFCYCMAVTDKGLLRFTIYTEDSSFGDKNSMDVFGFNIKSAAKTGDANGDGKIDVLDAANIQKYTASKTELTQAQLNAADVNGDGSVDILDAAQIQKFAAGIITEFKKAA